MKNKIFILTLALFIGLISCNKIVNDETGEPKKFSKLSPEEHKTEIQNSAINFVNEMETFVTSDGVAAIVNIVTMMEEMSEEDDDFDDDFDYYYKSTSIPPISILKNVKKLADNEIDAITFVTSLAQANEDDEPENIQEMYDEMKGTWEYNFDTEEFEQSSGDKVIIKFPSSSSATTNDATFTITEFKTKKITPVYDEMGDYMPTSVKANLTVGSTKHVEITMASTYGGNEIPTDLSVSVSISDFTFKASMKNSDNKEGSVKFSINNGSKDILVMEAGINGDFAEDNINSNIKYIKEEWDDVNYTYTQKEVSSTDDWDYQEVAVENILKGSYAFIDIFDVKIGGEVTIEKLVPEIEKIDEDEDAAWDKACADGGDCDVDEKPYVDREVKAMNEYVHLFASYIEDNKKIADVEFYTKEDTWEGEKDYDVDVRFIFGDDSKIDAETYFKTGFSKFFDAVNDMIGTMNKEYDAGMEKVDYDKMFD